MNLHDRTTMIFRTRWLCILAVWCSLLIPTAVGGELNDEEKDAGFVSMFNGKDFSGWRFTGKDTGKPPGNWSVEDGVIKLSGGGSPHLSTADEFANFEMLFEWRAMREKYNSGFFIRSPTNLGKNQLNLAKGGEGKFIGGKLEGAKAVPDLQKPAGEWNEWRVLVVDDTVTFWCNGQLAWKGTGLQPEKGYIGLQAEGAPLEFRNLRIRRIE
jgi:hypothetical protein